MHPPELAAAPCRGGLSFVRDVVRWGRFCAADAAPLEPCGGGATTRALLLHLLTLHARAGTLSLRSGIRRAIVRLGLSFDSEAVQGSLVASQALPRPTFPARDLLGVPGELGRARRRRTRRGEVLSGPSSPVAVLTACDPCRPGNKMQNPPLGGHNFQGNFQGQPQQGQQYGMQQQQQQQQQGFPGGSLPPEPPLRTSRASHSVPPLGGPERAPRGVRR